MPAGSCRPWIRRRSRRIPRRSKRSSGICWGLILVSRRTRPSRKRGLDLAASVMIGDRRSDIEAGRSAGCKTYFIGYGYDEKRPEAWDYRVKSLREAVGIILSDLDVSLQSPRTS